MTPPDPKTSLWTGPFRLLILTSLVISLNQMMITTTLPVLVIGLGGTAAAAGLVAGLFSLAALVTRPLFGHLLDRLSRSQVQLIGCFLFLAGVIPQYFYPSVTVMLASRVVQGFGFSAITTASATMVADLAPKARMASAIGYFSLAGTAAGAIGPSLGLYLRASFASSVLFLTIILLAVLGLLTAALIRDPVRPAAAPGPAWSGQTPDPSGEPVRPAVDSRYPFPGSLLEKTALPASLVMLFLAVSYSGILSFLAVFAAERQITGVGFFFTVYAAVIVLVRLVLGSMIDQLNHNHLLILAMLAMAAGMALLPLAHSLIVILGVGILYGAGFGLAYPLLNTLALQSCQPSHRGRANATFFVAMDIGIGLGSILLGLLSQQTSYATVFYTCLAMIGLSLTAYWLVLRRHVPT